MRRRWLIVALLGAAALVELPGRARVVPAQPGPQLGEPLNHLPPAALAAFNEGRGRFAAVETVATGLGPVFNDRSCLACHNTPAPGGTGAEATTFVTRFGLVGLQESD